MKNLQDLSLSNNRIPSIPDNISQVTALRKLYLDVNEIDILNPELCELVNLTDLNLSQNRIKRIPEKIGKMNLVDLDLSGNSIASLPQSIHNCVFLSQFKLSYNELRHFPPLEKCWCIYNGNPLMNRNYNQKIEDTYSIRKRYGWAEMCGRRPDQQDTIVIEDNFLEEGTILLCCFDGL